MSKEAMKLALERLQSRTDTADLDAIAALNEALAEQPAQQNGPWCMKMNGCKTKCEDCPDEVAEQPAQQNVQYTGNGTAGREADIKPTGFFFQMPAQTEAEQLANALEHMHLHAPAAELRRLVSLSQQLMDEVARLNQAVADERETCAKVVEQYTGAWNDEGYALAQTIRARGNT